MSGRGGAGNIIEAAAARAQSATASSGASKGPDDAAQPASKSQTKKAQQDANSDDAYLMSGRGGSGNALSVKKLANEGTFTEGAPRPAVIARTPSGNLPANARMQGRGGAGNFPTTEDASSPRAGPGENSFGGSKFDDVELGLARPGRAYLGPKEKERVLPEVGS